MTSAPLPTSMPPQSLSRTSSSTSFSSEDDASISSSTVTVTSTSRRTRKRFTNVQLTMLENLFHQNSHPSREEREAVANAGGMEIKSVTIWFQNKRQTERKTAASNSNTGNVSNVVPNITSTLHTFSLHNTSTSTSRTASPPFSASSRSTSTSTSSRPSLDRVASRTELRAAAPRTPSRRPTNTGAIWDNMPSSPLAPPISPPAREFIDFGKNAKTRRTLEWACAAARLADKDGYASGLSAGHASADRGSGGTSRGRSVRRENSHSRLVPRSSDRMDDDATDDEDHEAITPPSTWGKEDRRWTTASDGSHTTTNLTAMATGELPKGVDDDDMLKAALTLCGLGRRT